MNTIPYCYALWLAALMAFSVPAQPRVFPGGNAIAMINKHPFDLYLRLADLKYPAQRLHMLKPFKHNDDHSHQNRS